MYVIKKMKSSDITCVLHLGRKTPFVLFCTASVGRFYSYNKEPVVRNCFTVNHVIFQAGSPCFGWSKNIVIIIAYPKPQT